MDLENKIALVTGASAGIGREVALALAAEGAHIAINYNGKLDGAQKVKEEVEKIGQKAMIVQANVAKSEEVERMVKEVIEHFGRIDILVNNAGITKDNLLMRMKEEDWDAVLEVNLKGVFLCTKAVAKSMMKQRSGKIINIASVSGQMGNAGQANYAASKAGVIGFTKTVARELASRNINSNAVAPGFIATKMTDVLADDVKEGILKQVPLARLGTAKEVAHAVVFLASPKADYITGQVINVNGGMVM